MGVNGGGHYWNLPLGPTGDVNTNGPVSDGSIAVFDGASGNSIRAALANISSDGTIMSPQVTTEQLEAPQIRFTSSTLGVGNYVRAADALGNLEFAPLPGGGNVTTAGPIYPIH